MRSILTAIVIIGFSGMAVFGYIGMNHLNEMAHYGCLAALSQNGACPLATGAPLASAFFHLNILKSFSVALVNGVILLLMAAVAAFIGLADGNNDEIDPNNSKLSLYARRITFIANGFSTSTFDWLSLHVNSPAYALVR